VYFNGEISELEDVPHNTVGESRVNVGYSSTSEKDRYLKTARNKSNNVELM